MAESADSKVVSCALIAGIDRFSFCGKEYSIVYDKEPPVDEYDGGKLGWCQMRLIE